VATGDGRCDLLILDNIGIPFKNPTSKTFRRIAKRIGWEIKGNKCWCPRCERKLRHEEVDHAEKVDERRERVCEEVVKE